MRSLPKLMFLLIFSTTSLSAQAAMNITSIYTDLTGSKCKLVTEGKETGSSIQKCPGVGGFHLLVADDDARQSITIVDADQKEHPLDYWNVITRSFSSLGKKAEWRVIRHSGGMRPIALIVRVNVSEQVDLKLPDKTSFLAVAKISPEAICVTHKVPPAADAVVDGAFGPKTHQTVVAFQRQKRLSPDGIVGPRTWAALWTP